jgi:hypothetical protein
LASRYSVGDVVLYKPTNKSVSIKDIEHFRNMYGGWENEYVIVLDGDEKTVRASDLKLVKGSGVKKVSFKQMPVADGWTFVDYDKSNYYGYQVWSFSNKKNSISMYYYPDDKKFSMSWYLDSTGYQDFRKEFKTQAEAERFAYDLMLKFNNGKVFKPEWAK